MINLGSLQTRINEDDALRARFVADPEKTLRDEGIEISPAMASALKKLIAQQTAGENDVQGSSVSSKPGAHRPFGLL